MPSKTHNYGHMTNKSKEENMLRYFFYDLHFFILKIVIWVSMDTYIEVGHQASSDFFDSIVLPGHHSFSTSVRILEA